MPTPIPYHIPSGIKTYASATDWRQQHSAGNVPSYPSFRSRFWSDPAATLASQASGGIPAFPQFTDASSSPGTLAYAIPQRSPSGSWLRCKIGSPEFYASYAVSLAHNSMVQTMKDYAWVYELLGDPVLIRQEVFPASEVIEPNFGLQPNYPINLRSDYIYFTQNEKLVCLSTQDFIEYFKPQGITDYANMRKVVLELAQSTQLSDRAAISMIRLAVQEPKSSVLI